MERSRSELERSRSELELSRSEGMATQLKLKSKEVELFEERKLASNAKRYLEMQVEELEKKLEVSPISFSFCLQTLASAFFNYRQTLKTLLGVHDLINYGD